jgi:hypothetical protein
VFVCLAANFKIAVPVGQLQSVLAFLGGGGGGVSRMIRIQPSCMRMDYLGDYK